jgi:hypothetical protein
MTLAHMAIICCGALLHQIAALHMLACGTTRASGDVRLGAAFKGIPDIERA